MEKKQPCIFFLKGNCKKGKNCPFSHDVDVNMRSNNFSNINNNPMFQQNNNSHNCKYFMEGRCNRDGCSFFHGYCNRLQHFKTISNQKNLIKELIKTGNTSYISVDDNEFFARKLENPNENNDPSNKIADGFKIGKVIFSGNKVICSVEKSTP